MSRKRLYTFAVPVLLVVLGVVWVVRDGDAEGIQAEDQSAAEVAAEVLPGTWIWTWSGRIGDNKTTIVTTLKIESVAEDGKVQGAEMIKFGENDPFTVAFGEKDRAYSEDGSLRLRLQRTSDGGRIVYDLMPNKKGTSLKGSFSRPGWTTDKVEFVKQ